MQRNHIGKNVYLVRQIYTIAITITVYVKSFPSSKDIATDILVKLMPIVHLSLNLFICRNIFQPIVTCFTHRDNFLPYATYL